MPIAKGRYLVGLLGASVLGIAGFYCWQIGQGRRIALPDGGSLYFRRGTQIRLAARYPQIRELTLDGEALLVVPRSSAPLLLRTKQLLLQINGPADLKVTAYASGAGEEAEVLHGHVVARKNYASPNNAPESLEDGEMVMVNQSIDLLERETDDSTSTRAWADEIVREARRWDELRR